MKKTPLVFGIGQSSLDYIGLISSYPPPDVKCEFSNLVVQGGGPVATALVALRRWGLAAHMAGVVGDDDFGRQITKFLVAEGVDASGIKMRPEHLSQFAFIASEPSLARRTIFWQRPTGPPLKPHEISVEILEQCQALHIDGLFAEASIYACRKAKAAGIPVVLDAGTLRDGMLDIVQISDCVFASKVFSNAFSETHEETCRKLVGLGVRWAGVTLGEEGYLALIDGNWIRKKAYRVDAIDTTGCGDVFHAGLTYGIVQGWNAETSMDLGAWAAAEVAKQMGGRTSIPGRQSLITKYHHKFSP